MATFHVDKAFFLARTDQLVLTGSEQLGPIVPGMWVDLPVEVEGPGPVPIASVDRVRFADGREVPALVIDYHHLDAAPDMEFSHLEGRQLTVFSQLPGLAS